MNVLCRRVEMPPHKSPFMAHPYLKNKKDNGGRDGLLSFSSMDEIFGGGGV